MPKNRFRSTLTLLFLIYSSSSFSSNLFDSPPLDEATKEKLRRGEIITDGGYLENGDVWARMDAVVQAPADIVWGLFIDSNNLKNYGIPTLKDTRAVSFSTAQQTLPLKKSEDAYHTMGNEVYNPGNDRKPSTAWITYCFQYFDFPWPVANKWFVLKQTNDESNASEGIYQIAWEKFSGNVISINGIMTYTRFEGNPRLTLFHQEVRTNPDSHVPKFLLKWGVKHNMPMAMEAIRRESFKVYGKPPPLLKSQ